MDTPTTQEGWQKFFDKYFPSRSGVLVTLIGGPPDGDQMVGFNAFVEGMDDDLPRVVVQDVYNDFPFRFHVEDVSEEVEGHVLRVRAAEGQELTLSNRLMDEQRQFITARKEHGW